MTRHADETALPQAHETLSRKASRRNYADRREWVDGMVKRENERTVTFHPEGSLFTVAKEPGFELYDTDAKSLRGQVRGFSGKSRMRFLEFVATIDAREMPLFATLTYPREWPMDAQDWKYHLNTWAKNHLARRFPAASCVWKLEPQERGAPHFHLIIWGVPFMPHEWLAQTWYQVVGSGDPRHLQAGTQVERARSVNGVMNYAGKKYLGKEIHGLPRGWKNPGRFWGCYGRKNLPRSRAVKMTLSKKGFVRLRRMIRRMIKAKGIEWKGNSKGRIRVFTQKHLHWLRACEWAETGSCDSIDHGLPIEAQPF